MPGAYLYGFRVDTGAKVKILCTAEGKLLIDPTLILENPPTEDEAKKAATSEWCFDHKANAAAHHAKYTDLEAQTACNLNGDLYWSCSGIHFDAENPDTDSIRKASWGGVVADFDGINFIVNVNLPTGATVTKVIVYGNSAAGAETWSLYRINLSTSARTTMATGNINSEDSSIDNEVIDNSSYGYFIYTSSLDTDDQIWGARITYTL